MSTASRVVRCTNFRRIFIFIWVLLVVIIIVSLYTNTLTQLDTVRKSSDQCHQQQENLSTQLQVIFDYKQRLEKSLKTEKAEHQHDKKRLEARLQTEVVQFEKDNQEMKLKFVSLQQHYNLLVTQFEDYKAEHDKFEKQQLVQIDSLQTRLKASLNGCKKNATIKDRKMEELKNQYMKLQVEKETLEKRTQGTYDTKQQWESEVNHLTKTNHELQRELNELRTKYHEPTLLTSAIYLKPEQSDHPPPKPDVTKTSTPTIDAKAHNNNNDDDVLPLNNPANVADLPANGEVQQQQPEQVAAPKLDHAPDFSGNREPVLALPNIKPNANAKSSTRTAFQSRSSPGGNNLAAAQPLLLPTVSSSTPKTNEEAKRAMPLPLPKGVVSAPALKKERSGDEKEIRDDVNNAFPNRYRANLILNELANEDKAIEADEKEKINEVKHKSKIVKLDAADKENNALEVFDPPANDDKVLLEGDAFAGLAGKGKELTQGQEEGEKAAVNGDYEKDNQLEENEPEADDDDPEDYQVDHMLRDKEPAVRN